MSTSTAVARIEPQPKAEDVTAEKIPVATALVVPAALLLAAESVTAKPGGPAAYLEGVYLHARGDRCRAVGMDGGRLFVASFPAPSKDAGGMPPWLRKGVILSASSLRSRVALLGKLSGERGVKVSYAEGNGMADLSDERGNTVFRVAVLAGQFPNYEAALGEQTFADLGEDGEQPVRDWQPVGINSAYLKQCGDIAKTLEAGLDKDARSKLGMIVRAFNGGGPGAPLVFDFSTWPGAILAVLPADMPTNVTSKETAALLAPALKSTVAALRAHATRWDQQAAAASSEHAKSEATAKAEGFRRRVASILATVPASPALGADKQPKAEPVAPKPEPEPKVEPKADPVAAAPEPEPKPEPGEDEPREEAAFKKPATKRTKIKVNSQHAPA